MNHDEADNTAMLAISMLPPDKIDLVKRTVAKGATDDELEMFLYVAQRSGLNPFLRQIHAVKRWNAEERREVMAIQVGIDGLRLVADRTGRYAPGRDTIFGYNDAGELENATAFVKKHTVAGLIWHEYSATALFGEYAQRKRDGSVTQMWATKPHIMLAKCAEALALRRGFPAETSGLYIHEELPAENDDHAATLPPVIAMPEERATTVPTQSDIAPIASPPAPENLSENDRRYLLAQCKRHGRTFADLKNWLGTQGVASTLLIPASLKAAAEIWIAEG